MRNDIHLSRFAATLLDEHFSPILGHIFFDLINWTIWIVATTQEVSDLC